MLNWLPNEGLGVIYLLAIITHLLLLNGHCLYCPQVDVIIQASLCVLTTGQWAWILFSFFLPFLFLSCKFLGMWSLDECLSGLTGAKTPSCYHTAFLTAVSIPSMSYQQKASNNLCFISVVIINQFQITAYNPNSLPQVQSSIYAAPSCLFHFILGHSALWLL